MNPELAKRNGGEREWKDPGDVSSAMLHQGVRAKLFPVSLCWLSVFPWVCFLTRSASLRAGLRRNEESFQPPLRHDFAALSLAALISC
jgi:hypothetical protein